MHGKTNVFNFDVWYFKANGKFYANAKFDHECQISSGDSCYMYDVVEHFEGLRKTKRSMPGLSGHWDGPIVINCEQGWPCLIP